MARKPVPHEITLTAWGVDDERLSIMDIRETSFHHASFHVRGFLRDPDIRAISACRPGDKTLGKVRYLARP